MPKYGQPVISRETRLLLITIVVSVCTLWLLARLRFQDRPVAATVAPVLAQLRPRVQLRRSGTFAVEPSAGCGRDHRRLRRRQAGAPNRRCGGNRPRRIRFRANAPSRSRRAGGDGLDAAHLRLSALSRRGRSRGRDALAASGLRRVRSYRGEPCLGRPHPAPPVRARPRAWYARGSTYRGIARGSRGEACGRACVRARTSRCSKPRTAWDRLARMSRQNLEFMVQSTPRSATRHRLGRIGRTVVDDSDGRGCHRDVQWTARRVAR